MPRRVPPSISDQKSTTATELEREDAEYKRLLQRIDEEEKKLAKLTPRLEAVRRLPRPFASATDSSAWSRQFFVSRFAAPCAPFLPLFPRT